MTYIDSYKFSSLNEALTLTKNNATKFPEFVLNILPKNVNASGDYFCSVTTIRPSTAIGTSEKHKIDLH